MDALPQLDRSTLVLGERLGVGSFGSVYHATSTTTSRQWEKAKIGTSMPNISQRMFFMGFESWIE